MYKTIQINTTRIKNACDNTTMRNPEGAARFGKRLKQIRVERKILQVDVAVAAGINPNHYSKIERGKVGIRMSTFEKLAKGFGFSLSKFWRVFDD